MSKSITVRCSTCRAESDQYCRTEAGTRAKQSHYARNRLWAATLRDPPETIEDCYVYEKAKVWHPDIPGLLREFDRSLVKLAKTGRP